MRCCVDPRAQLSRQVQHLAPELPVFLDLRLGSADPRASLPCALHAAAIRSTAALNFGRGEPRACALRSDVPYAIMSIPSTAAISSTFSRPSSDWIEGPLAWRCPGSRSVDNFARRTFGLNLLSLAGSPRYGLSLTLHRTGNAGVP